MKNRKKPFQLRPSGKNGYHTDLVIEIDQFIPEAVQVADKEVSGDLEIKNKNSVWDRTFHAEMDRLTSEAGLRVL